MTTERRSFSGQPLRPGRAARRALAVLACLLVPLAVAQDDAPATAPEPATATAPATMPEPFRFRPKPEVPPPPLPEQVERAFVIPIKETFEPKLLDAVRRKVLEARARGAQMIIFELDTPGGRGDVMLEITDLIRRELQAAGIRTVAFVNPDAISAGAITALAADEIVMVPNARLGDAAPITMTGAPLGEVEREKAESYIRSEVRSSAEANGYPAALAEAMVSASLEVWLVRNLQTGEERFVTSEEWRGRVRVRAGVADAQDNPDAEWDLVRVIVPKDRLLTMTTQQAVEYGFASRVVSGMDALRREYNIVNPVVYLGDTWSETLAGFLTSPLITGLLFVGIVLFGYLEMNTPGFGIFGTLAIACAAVLLGSRFLTGLAQWWEIAILVVGVGLLLLEIFVTPGFGVLGISGIACILVGLLAILVANAPDQLPLPSPGLILDQFLGGLFAVGLGLVGGILASVIAAHYLPRLPLANRLVLRPAPAADTYHPDSDEDPLRAIGLGDRGVLESLCRPVGKARFGEALVDVVTDGEFLPAGTRVVVARNEGNRLLVRRERA